MFDFQKYRTKFSWIGIILLSFLPHYAFSPSVLSSTQVSNLEEIEKLYTLVKSEGLTYEALITAYEGFERVKSKYFIDRDTLLTIVDFSLPSSIDRLYVLDIKNYKLLFQSLVSHGMNTGELYASSFSNKPQSHKSSLGFYSTQSTYIGKHGYSLRISGLEKGFNDNAQKRAIVIHGAHYASMEYIQKYGRLGRSYGCPAVPLAKNKKLIDLIKDNSCLFIYYPDHNYLANSEILKFSPLFQATQL